MRRIFEAMQDAMGAVLAWAIVAWAVHELYQKGYDDGYDAREQEIPAKKLAAVPDPVAEDPAG